MLELNEIQGLFPNVRLSGFSAYKATLGVSGDTMVTNWSNATPFFSSNNFNVTSGIYTIPAGGVYAIMATIGYSAPSTITTQLDANVAPYFSVQKIASPNVNLMDGKFPILDIDIHSNKVRTILRSSTVSFSSVLQLVQGDRLGLFYNSETFNLSLTLQKIQWTAFRLTEN